MKHILFNSCIFAASVMTWQGTANADWFNRTVTEVDGTFTSMQPAFGAEVGLGTSRVDWGVPLSGSFTSYLSFQGFDAFPGADQPWFSGGQTVMPGQRFFAGTVEFRNGTLAIGSSGPNSIVALQVSVFGSEFQIDNHPLVTSDTWKISITQTPNGGDDPVADADYIYFTDFPSLGTFRLFEGRTTSVQVFARFGSIEPAGFGAVADPTAGVVLPLDTVPEPSSFALVACSLGCLLVTRGFGRFRRISRVHARQP